MAHVLSKTLNLPQWVLPACSFNNTTSLPLLLLDSLDSVGSLRLILRKGETTSNEIDRAQSYFLLCAVTSKTIAYVVGPKMLHDGSSSPTTYIDSEPGTGSESEPGAFFGESYRDSSYHDETQDELEPTEATSLFPRPSGPFTSRLSKYKAKLLDFFPHRMKQNLMAPFESPFADVAICCTFLGATLGLVPTLHRAFFARDEDGGIFNAWLTTSIRNIGRLFTTLQIFMVGCKLGVTLERMFAENRERRLGRLTGDRDSSSRIPVRAIAVIFLFRLVVWPAISIPVIYGFARAKLLGDDSMLWFSMMLIPAGPPALIILGLAELAKASEGEKMAIAKSLTVSFNQSLWWVVLADNNGLDYVCIVACCVFYDNRGTKSSRGSLR